MKSNLYLALFAVISLFSCEEVIDISLEEVEPRIVIEGIVTDQPGPYTVSISKSVGFYEDNEFPGVEGAYVEISDDLGNVDVLEDLGEGKYQTTELQGQRGVNYSIKVEVEGNTYTAESKMQEKQVMIDSLAIRYEEESLFYKEGYYLKAYFEDPPGLGNYYSFNVYVNGEVYVFDNDGEMIEDDNFWLWDDKFTDGNVQDYDFPHTLKEGDELYVMLRHLNWSTYDYYRTLVEVIDGGGVAPSNPLSNFGDTALGYFAAYSVTDIEGEVE
ncbi:DUF4249 domain-containing protein [Echinicola marina]|uniref:DUF4249 domain-containing protein n=1 Tax=Echinicola marina TaxID=2859768 RepID=UPI001CF652E2|nr:DUF4249 domain-containing protein [Echinicola marina]UCS91616.1 DUF4249 domain-containing protein [Echinicola marina]